MKKWEMKKRLRDIPLIKAPDSLDQRVFASLQKLESIETEPSVLRRIFSGPKLAFSAVAVLVAVLLTLHANVFKPDISNQKFVIKMNSQQSRLFDLSRKQDEFFEKKSIVIKSLSVKRKSPNYRKGELK